MLDHAVSTSNKEQLAGQPASLLRCKECHNIRHIFRISNASKWDLHVQPLLQLWRNIPCLNWPWRDDIDRNPISPQLTRCRAAVRFQGELAGSIGDFSHKAC